MKKLLTFILWASITLWISFTQATEYSQEFQDAYNRAYENWIITETPIDNANLNKALTNEELAEIMIKFSEDVLGKTRTPDMDWACSFAMENEKLMELCELNLVTSSDNIDLNTWTNRAIFGKILARAIRWRQYEWWTPSYSKHLNALKEAWIINQIEDPESIQEIKWYTLNTLKRTTMYYKDNICEDAVVRLACLDSTTELYKECPKLCRKNWRLTNNLTKTADFSVNETNRKVVFDWTYYALEDDTLKFFWVEDIDKFMLDDDPDYFTKRCNADSGNNNLKFYLIINWEEIDDITIEEACEFWYGAAKWIRIDNINVRKWETYNVKVEAEVEAYTEDTWNIQMILQNSGFSRDTNDDIKAPLTTIRTVKFGELSIESWTEKKLVYLKGRNQSIATFTVKPSDGNEWYLDSIVVRTRSSLTCNDLRFKVDWTEYDCYNTWNDLLYQIDEIIGSTWSKIDIILKNSYEWEYMIGIMSINNQHNYKDWLPIPLKTFTKRFEPALVYITSQNNLNDSTEYTLWVDTSDSDIKVSNVKFYYSSNYNGENIDTFECEWLLPSSWLENSDIQDGTEFRLYNEFDEDLEINCIEYDFSNSWNNKKVSIRKLTHPDYFKSNNSYRKVFKKENIELSIQTPTERETVFLKWRNTTLAEFTIKATTWNSTYLNELAFEIDKPQIEHNNIRIKIDGTEYDFTWSSDWYVYNITCDPDIVISSKWVDVTVILKKELEYDDYTIWTTIKAINWKPINTSFTKRFVSVLAYISKQENKWNYTEFTLWIDKYDDNYLITSICMLTWSTGAGTCLMGEKSDDWPFEDWFTFSINNSDSNQAINYIFYFMENPQRTGWADSISIEKEDYRDYFKIGSGYREIFAKSDSSNSQSSWTSWKSSWWGGGWWGGEWSSISKTNDANTTKDKKETNIQDDKKWETEDKNEKETIDTNEINNKVDTQITTIKKTDYDKWNPTEILNNWYTREMNNAYKFAHDNWITTTKNIEKAKMNSPLTRIAMAKMLSNYAINILWKSPDTSKWTVKFKDVTDKENTEYDNAVTLSYQLWIMWQNMKNNKFRPNNEVTRAEFATALSRMLYWTEDEKWNTKYYETHMEKLLKEWIITKDDPKIKEKRGYVMIMLMRTAE